MTRNGTDVSTLLVDSGVRAKGHLQTILSIPRRRRQPRPRVEPGPETSLEVSAEAVEEEGLSRGQL